MHRKSPDDVTDGQCMLIEKSSQRVGTSKQSRVHAVTGQSSTPRWCDVGDECLLLIYRIDLPSVTFFPTI